MGYWHCNRPSSFVLAIALAGCGGAAGSGVGAGAGGMPSESAGTAAAAPATPCVTPDTGLPDDVFCTGLYRGRDTTSYDPSARPYTPGVTLWSDGADKQRYLYLPPGATIDTSDMDVWKFPVGTKAWKEFRFGGKLVETRLFWKRDASTWESGTYIWDADQRNASLNTSRQPVLIASGYEIPTAKDCGKCHHGGADKLLGVEAVALGLSTARGVTLAQLVSDGALSNPPASTSIALPEDATGLAGAALGYLHANCGMPCHSTRGLGHETELVMRLRAGEFWPAAVGGAAATDSYRATVGQQAVTGAVTAAFPDALRITPGAHDRSLVWLLAHRRGDYQMPPLVSHQIDEAGMQELAAWIDALSQ
jgi:hypothetical protein